MLVLERLGRCGGSADLVWEAMGGKVRCAVVVGELVDHVHALLGHSVPGAMTPQF